MIAAVLQQPTVFQRLTRLVGLYLLSPTLLIMTIPVAVHITQNPDFGVSIHQLTVVAVDAGGPAAQAGLAKGDQVLAVDGQTTPTMIDYFVATSGSYDLRARTYSLRREGRVHTVQVQPRRPLQSRMIRDYSLWVAGLAFLVMGWWVLSKGNDPVARNFFVLCFVFAFFLADIPNWPSHFYMTVKENVRYLLQLLCPAYFLRFFLHFPTTTPAFSLGRMNPRLLLLPILPLFLMYVAIQLMGLDLAQSPFVMFAQYASIAYFVLYFLVGLFIFGRRVWRRDHRIQHTKMRVVLFGLLCGLLPFLVAMLLGSVRPDSPVPQWQYMGFSLLLVPLSFGVAILRYGALDTAFVVRSSLIYGLLSILLLAAYFIGVGLLGSFLAATFHVSTNPLLIVTVAACCLAFLPLRRNAQRLVDRTFYPARQANRAAILELGQDLTGLIEQRSATDILLRRLFHLYRPTRMSLFLRSNPDAETLDEVAGISHGEPAKPVYAIGTESGLADFLNQMRRPVFVEEFEGLLLAAVADTESHSLLIRLDCELLVPLVTGNRLSGFLCLGPKSDGALYSQEDLANLRLLAVQAGALLESQRLYQESLSRRKLETELAVAKEIQARLLPTEPLVMAGVQIHGRNQPSRHVGGDYFDYFPLDSQTLGFCIADVAGKGIPAALMMTTLRVAFRAEAIRGREPERVITQMNHEVLILTDPGQFVCFFYGTFDCRSGQLNYCNAGMDPPVLFRKRRSYVEKLKKGGPVLGVSPEHRYRRGTLSLEAEDLLLAYTDGMTDQTDSEGNFFDLDRLIDALRANKNRPFATIPDRILTTVEQFGGALDSDDKTVMVLQFSELAQESTG